MATPIDPRVDAYIRKAAPFARPILSYLREIVHEGCPDAVETIKWSRPFFDYRGPLCGLAAFKAHCVFHFWKGIQMVVPDAQRSDEAMGQFGRIVSIDDLPPRRQLVAMVKKAAALNESGVKAPWMEQRVRVRAARAAKPIVVPTDLVAALARNAKARRTFDAFSPSHRREYIEWIEDAKRQDTRDRRLATAVSQMAEGKRQNWKYEKR
ncbi:MAG: YdeI/OmpD-associated family protein [Vicinamibacterales bacterium]